ncbi:MAG: Ig-like domain-containing protein [Rhodoglobus sp.]
MFRQWLAAHKSLVATATSGSVITALVVTVAVVSTGYTAQRLDLGDASVWVANGQQQVIGRANTEVLELNTVVPTTGSDISVVQQGSTVLLFDRGNSKLDIIDPATSTVTDSVPLPPNRPEVFLAGKNVVIHERGTGEVWIVAARDLASFDAESPSTLSLGVNAVADVDANGMMFAFSPETQQLYRLNAALSDAVDSTTTVPVADAGGDFSVTSVDGRWAVFDARARMLYLDGHSVDLSGLIEASDAVLQDPSTSGDAVLVSHSGGLVSVPLGGGNPTPVVTGDFGPAARPMVMGGCEFAAWTTAQAWRKCAGDAAGGQTLDLTGMTGAPVLSFVANGDRLVLNDERSGGSWAVQRSGELIDNWDELITVDENQPQQQENDQDTPPEVDKVQQPPIAIDDVFGARPARATVLPVLLNDYDPNGDVLVIDSVSPIDESVGRIDLINEKQQLQLTLQPGATGSIEFSYTISDGRGGNATAHVSVTVRQPTENSPPEQVRTTKATVQSGGRVTTQVLGDWVDPDGDAIYLTAASVASPNSVSYKPEGTIVYSDGQSGTNLAIVSLLVSDGSAEGSGTVSVSVKPAGQVPLIAEPFEVLAYAGQEITVSPLDHVRGGNGTVRLNSVPAKSAVTIVPSYETGTFRFSSDQVRTHYIEYVVTDGDQTVTGLVRIDVASPPDANTKPITIPKTVFVHTLSDERVDVAGTDQDPAGGVLLVTGVMNVPAASGVRAQVLDQRFVRVSLDKPLDDGPVTFNYRISNGLAEAEGVITVVEIAAPIHMQAPVANDDSITARVGQAIDIPVLDNDEHPDDADLTLVPELAQALPQGSGLLFASDNQLRYLAPHKTGNFTAVYQVEGPDGQRASAQVHIAVREADAATNNAPVPATVTARVLAGQSVAITIPLTGIDPDGDSVQLLGQATNPEKGSVQSTGADSFVYQAGTYSAGTDSFTYTVIDALGMRATGTVRVGISPRLDGARNPVAVLDEVTVRPGVTVNVEVLANDSDPDGSPLSVTRVEPNNAQTTAEIVGNVVKVTPPKTPGTYGVIYSIENEFGGTSQNFIRVKVDPDAPRAYPVARDTVLTLSDVQGRTSVNVDVLANVFFADGSARSLGLAVYPGYGDVAQVTSNKRIRVTIQDQGQIIPFVVTHPDDPKITSYAFIKVPGLDDALPQLDRRAQPLTVHSEDALTINLNDYVVAVGGKQVRLTDTSTVRATHSNGEDLVVDQDTLVFTSADKYFGPASISFEVTDGTSASDPNGHKAILVLPITVLPRNNQPPVFDGAVLDFEPGQQKELDLLKLTTYPYPDDLGELAYSALAPAPTGFSYALNGSKLTIKADDDAVKGSVTALTLGVKDDLATGQSGRIQLTVVQSTRPLLQPTPDVAIVKRGTTSTVDVLTNDESTNPFPGKPLKVIAIRGIDGGALPAGVTITPSANKSTLSVTIDPSAVTADVSLQYEVADASGDPDRYVWGSIRISIQDRPDPPTNALPSGFSDKTITMHWNAGSFNNSPITGYTVSVFKAGGALISTRDCPATTCDLSTPGNGPSNSVTVSVVAHNSIGDSDPSALSPEVWSDIIPPAPPAVSSAPLDHGIHLEWTQVSTPAGGSPVDRYHVVVGANETDVNPSACSGGTCSWNTPAEWGLTNGVAVSFTVSPRNAAFTALSIWNTSEPQSETPAGPPIANGAPTAGLVADSSVTLDWGAVFDSNGRPISDYVAAAFTGAAPTCAANGTVSANGATLIDAGTAGSTEFDGLSANATYSLMVFAYNGIGCTASPIVVAHTPPGIVTDLQKSGPSANGSVFDFTLTGGSIGGDDLTGEYTLYYKFTNVDATEYGPIGLNQFLTGSGQQYGHDVGVQVRACRTYDTGPVCQSTYSAAFPLGTAIDPQISSLTATFSVSVSGTATFNWLGWPSGSYEGIQYACGNSPGGGSFAAADTSQPGTCQVDTGLLGLQPAYLTIRVIANGGLTYDISYNGHDYD